MPDNTPTTNANNNPNIKIKGSIFINNKNPAFTESCPIITAIPVPNAIPNIPPTNPINPYSIKNICKISAADLTCAIIASTSSGLLNISRAVSKGMLIWLSSCEFPTSFNTPTILNSFPFISILFPNLNVLSNISFITLEPTIASYLSPSLINLPSSNFAPESKKNPSKFSTGIPLTNVNPTSFLYLTSVERNIPGTTYSNPDIFSTVSTSSIVNPSRSSWT